VLDAIDPDPDLEEDERVDGGDDEPSLGSFDRMIDQSKAWRTQSLWASPAVDTGQDDCDREDDDPNEEKQQPPEMSSDDELGIIWWNRLTERARWAKLAGTGCAKDAWEVFKRSGGNECA